MYVGGEWDACGMKSQGRAHLPDAVFPTSVLVRGGEPPLKNRKPKAELKQ